MKRVTAGLILIGALLLSTIPGRSQSTNSADIRGTATDSTEALLPGVQVTVLNTGTGVSKTFVTNQDGVYDTSSILPGNYKITFSKQGFEDFVRSSITIGVGIVTVDGSLRPGSTSESVVVKTELPLLTTETGGFEATLQQKDIETLPIVGEQMIGSFMYVFPGAIPAAGGVSGGTAATQGESVASYGNLPYVDILTDGASVVPAHNGVPHPADSEAVAEIDVVQNGFSAEYGLGGTVVNQITKSGTNQFHGAVYDHIENTAFDAAQYGFGQQIKVPILHYHEFGGDVGGPVLKNRVFFFFNYDQEINNGGASNATYTVPTSQLMGGNFTGLQQIYDPTTQTIAYDAAGNPYPVRQSFASEYGSNAIPNSLNDTVVKNEQMFYPTSSSHIAGGQFVTGVTGRYGEVDDNFYSSVPSTSPKKNIWARVDYDLTSTNRLSGSVMRMLWRPDAAGEGLSDVFQCPIGCQTVVDNEWNAQITDVWNISPRTINEARLGFLDMPSIYTDTALGKGLAAKLGWSYARVDDIPQTSIGPWYGIASASNAFYKEVTWDPSDVVTMIRGRHILHFGGELTSWIDDSTAWGNANAGTFNFSGEYTEQWTLNEAGIASPNPNTGVPYADFLLGLSNSYRASVTPEYYARFKAPQFFVQDDVKVRPNLTVNLGLRYHFSHGWLEKYGNESSFDPTITNPATNTSGAMWYGVTRANGRTALQANLPNIWMPRVGFAWQPRPNMTVRGGFGRFTYFWTLDTNATGMGGAFSSSGSISDQTNGITPIVKLGGNGDIYGTSTPLPYVAASTAPQAYNGQSVSYSQYHEPPEGTYQWNLSVARQFGQNTSVELAYIATHGFNLSFPTDINQVPESALAPNDKTARPYPQFQTIGGSTNNAISNYNGLSLTVQQRAHAGLSYNLNYIYSNFLDEQDSWAYGGTSEVYQQVWQNAYDLRANYSNSDFNLRQMFKGRLVYELPFGRSRKFVNNSTAADEAIGGWRVSTFIWSSSGYPFTVYGTQSTYALSGSALPNRVPGVSPKPANRNVNNWINPAAFSQPANGTYGDVRRNSLFGPSQNFVNLSAGKTFSIWENVKFELNFDALNVFNHPLLGTPSGTLGGSSGPGTPYTIASPIRAISPVMGGRQGELHARITF